jgi:arylsulfatase A-like enzyme
MKRRTFLKTASALATGAAVPLRAEESARPNILVIISDDQGKQWVSPYKDGPKTPHLQKLAAAGVIHHRAYTNSALCVPTRYCCLTGNYASRCTYKWFSPLAKNSFFGNGTAFKEDEQTVPMALRNAGYYTGIAGKWHNSGGHALKANAIPADADIRDPAVIAKLKRNQQRLAADLRKWGFDYAASLYSGNLSNYGAEALQHHNMEYIVKGALDFLDGAPGDKPFYLWMALTQGHGPRERIEAGDIHATPEGHSEDHLEVVEKGYMPTRKEIVRQAGKGPMAQTMAWVDAGVGAVLRKLRETGRAKDTLVIYLSDQGNVGKSTNYESGTCISFMARWPGVIRPNTQSHALVDTVDMAATFMDVAKAEDLPGMNQDGQSILPIWQGKREANKTAIFTEIGYSRAVATAGWKYHAIRYPRWAIDMERRRRKDPDWLPPVKGPMSVASKQLWRKISPSGQNRANVGICDLDQLYNLRDDPNERTNLAGRPEYAAKLQEMKALLATHIKRTGRSFGEFHQAKSAAPPAGPRR